MVTIQGAGSAEAVIAVHGRSCDQPDVGGLYNPMKEWKVLIARTISLLVWLLGGGALQIGLWKTSDRTYFDALMQHQYLWIVYLFLGLLAGEHCLRLIKRRW